MKVWLSRVFVAVMRFPARPSFRQMLLLIEVISCPGWIVVAVGLSERHNCWMRHNRPWSTTPTAFPDLCGTQERQGTLEANNAEWKTLHLNDRLNSIIICTGCEKSLCRILGICGANMSRCAIFSSFLFQYRCQKSFETQVKVKDITSDTPSLDSEHL